MKPSHQSPTTNPTELVAVIFEKNGRDELRFLPTCRSCGEIIFDLAEANVAGVNSGDLKRIGSYRGATISRFEGGAFAFHWQCDKGRNVPWSAAALTFRNRDDREQQHQEPPFHSTTARVPR